MFGEYFVSLIVTSAFGCQDTTYSIINMKEELLYYIPNSFTPDGNIYNETFLPVFTSGFDPADFTMIIYNRWGQVVFESHDASIGWNGRFGIDGEHVTSGVFTWKIEFREKSTEIRKKIIGNVNLMR